jgi:branched-chain amino acid transport system ATP-binding protein
MDVIMEISDRIVAMAEGKKIAEGPPEAVQADEQVLESYLGG